MDKTRWNNKTRWSNKTRYVDKTRWNNKTRWSNKTRWFNKTKLVEKINYINITTSIPFNQITNTKENDSQIRSDSTYSYKDNHTVIECQRNGILSLNEIYFIIVIVIIVCCWILREKYRTYCNEKCCEKNEEIIPNYSKEEKVQEMPTRNVLFEPN